jgi:hypothetical protein
VIPYGDDKGKYRGTTKFGDERGEVSLNLSPEHVDQIFHVCADAIIATAKRAASDMTANIIEQVGIEEPALPDPKKSFLAGAMSKIRGDKP